MISSPLFKRNMVSSLKLNIIFIAVLAMYTSIIIYMFDPELAGMLEQYQEMMPGMMSAVGMSGSSGTLIEFIHTYLYGFIMLIFPLIFEIILVNKMVMKYVDSGSMACLLATPNSRCKIIVTQVLSICLSVIFLIIVTTMIGLFCSNIMFPGDLDIEKYIQLNFSILLLHFVLSGIAFLSACLFNESKGYFALGAGIPLAFYLINMLANMGNDLEKFKYFTIFTLVPGEEIIAGTSNVIYSNLTLCVIGILLYIFGSVYFVKKDLPL